MPISLEGPIENEMHCAAADRNTTDADGTDTAELTDHIPKVADAKAIDRMAGSDTEIVGIPIHPVDGSIGTMLVSILWNILKAPPGLLLGVPIHNPVADIVDGTVRH